MIDEPDTTAMPAGSPLEPELAEDCDTGALRLLELQHRIKNLLAIVQSLVNLTLRDGVPLAEARDSLNGRLAAMAGAVARLTDEPRDHTSLGALLGHVLGQTGSDRMRIAGPEVDVGPDSALTLSLAFHELESNAAKYGALSHPHGLVTVRWSTQGDLLQLDWLEQGGPRVEPPTRLGFGSKLVERAAASRLGGRCTLDFDPSGIRYSLEVPLKRLAH